MAGATLRGRTMVLSILLFIVAGVAAHAQVPVTTWHYDNAHSGANTNETILTPQNVNDKQFGKIFSQPVDDAIIGQALYLPGVKIPGAGKHNVVFVATMNDSVYAFDADSSTGKNASPLWQTSFLSPGVTPVPIKLQKCGGVTHWDQVGIVSTPVIDPVSGTLYVLAKTFENSTNYVNRLHALDVKTGHEKPGSPVVITASYELNGVTNVFADMMEVNRPALLLTNGNIYIAFGSNGCRGGKEEGWVVSYNATTLAPMGAFDDEPSSYAAAIWQRGGGLSTDSEGFIYGATADGPFTAGTNFGESVFKLAQVGDALQLSDWFTPYNEAYLNDNDLDMSQPVLVLPDQAGKYPHLALAVGKEGTIYVLNRDNLGQFCSKCQSKNGDTQIVQELALLAPETGAMVFWNNIVYVSPNSAPIASYPLTNGVLGTTPIAQSKKVSSGHSPVITSNGTSSAVLWQLNGADLTSYDASTLVKIYSSNSAPANRDRLPALPHFANLMVVNGKLYIGTNNSLYVYGLLQGGDDEPAVESE